MEIKYGRMGQDRFAVWRNFFMYPKVDPHVLNKVVWGYVNRHSIEPGGCFNLMLSAGPAEKSVFGRIEVYRIGYEGSEDRRMVWRSESIEVLPYVETRAGRRSVLLSKTASSIGPCWAPTLSIQETYSWTSGYYSIDFVTSESYRDSEVAYIVVTDPKKEGDIIVKLATATYQAYN
ncbi:MAG: N,N-dimethylformamidase beta subunit family domain-containing protein, partial [bacterium]